MIFSFPALGRKFDENIDTRKYLYTFFSKRIQNTAIIIIALTSVDNPGIQFFFTIPEKNPDKQHTSPFQSWFGANSKR